MTSLNDSKHKDLLYPLLNDFEGFNHWFSIVATRNHGSNRE